MKLEIDSFDRKNKPKRDLVVKTTKEKSSFFDNKTLPYIAGSVIILILALYSYVDFLGKPATEKSTDFVYYEVKSGASKRQIALGLKNKKLIRSSQAFLLSTYFFSKGLKAGHYKLASSMSMEQIIEKIENGEVDAFTVTIPEGYRVLQIAKKLEDSGKVNSTKFLAAATGTEGTLFPDTYVIPYGLEEAKIVKMFKDDFETRTAKLRPTDDQLILASIVEREAIKDDERPKIAAVYRNRADKNMLLQADPTVRYGLDSQKYLQTKKLDFEMWSPLTKSDISSLNSSFNTYKQKGFPPAPICNPGIKSIEAAVNPQKDFDFLFFFHDKNQNIHFSKSYEEHLKAIQEFGV
jgi:UPF0755 protein